MQVKDSWNCPSPVYTVIIKQADGNLPAPVYKSLYLLRGSDTSISLASPYQNEEYQLLDASKNLIAENTMGRFDFLNMQNDFDGFVRLTRGSCTTPDAAVKIEVADTMELKIPNACSPNGDGINECKCRWIFLTATAGWSTKAPILINPGMAGAAMVTSLCLLAPITGL
ncbi:MAG: hypothetical protein ABIX01_09580 [Chitinophagaceae bacterium]